MTNIDSLGIRISASAQSATKSLNTLITQLGRLSTQLDGLNGKNFTNFATGMNSLSTAMSKFQNIKTTDFTKIAKGIEKFNSIDSSKLSSIGNALTPLATGVSVLNNAKFDNKNVQNLINSLTRLSSVNTQNLANTDFSRVGRSISALATTLSSAPKVQQSVISMTNALANLASAGANIRTLATNLPLLETPLRNFMAVMSRAPVISTATVSFTNALALLGNAGNKIGIVASQLPQLSTALLNFFQVMSRAPRVSNNTIQMTNALANLSSQNNRVNISSRSMNSGLTGVRRTMDRTTRSTRGLVSAIGMFYARFFLLIRAFRSLGRAIKSSMDYIENLNYFNKAFSQVASKADLSAWKELGYKSAQEYGSALQKELANQALVTTSKMSGYVLSDSGMVVNSRQKSLGINPTQVMKYQAMYAQMASSMGVASDTAAKMSQALTEIGADLSSVRNMDFDKVWTDMASGLAGRERLVA